MNLSQVEARQAAITTELTTIRGAVEALEAADGDWTDEQRAEWQGHNEKVASLLKEQADLRARADLASKLGGIAAEPASAPTIMKRAGDPFDLNSIRYGAPVAELRSRARAAVESIDYIEDSAKGEAIRKLEKVHDARGVIPGLILRTGAPAYQSAFHKGLAGAQHLWTDEERAAVGLVEEFRTAMSLTDQNGGYAIPFTLDPSIILTNSGTTNPVRRLARVETVTGDNWNGLSSAGVDASFDADNTEVSDDSPTFAQPTIAVRMARAFVQGSIAISQDYRNLANDLATMFADSKDRLESTVFWSGAAVSNQPVGIETALAGGSSIVAQTTGEAMTVADIYKVLAALPARHRGRPSTAWAAEISTINFIRQFATANNYHAFLTDLAGDVPSRLLGVDLHEWSAMDPYSSVDAAATATNHLLLIGEWSNYLIADRVGGSIEFIPHIFNTNANLPSFTRGWAYFWRVGADSINDDAFRLLALTTAA